MPGEVSYTTEEIARLLKISKLTVYDIIKKGDLPAYRVGRQMRIDADDLEAYKQRSRMAPDLTGENMHAMMPAATTSVTAKPAAARAENTSSQAVRQVVITGQDASLDILARYIEGNTNLIRPLRSHAGSLDSLIAMYHGHADVVSTHLWDGDTGEYNLSYVHKILVNFPYIVINVVLRTTGFYVKKDNPKKISDWTDLKKQGVQIINREKGSGIRVLLDEKLRLAGISPRLLTGYYNEATNHLGVAGKVAGGEADVGLGIQNVASIVDVDFVPLVKERYDLVMLKLPQNKQWIETIKQVLQSESFKNELGAISGYDLSHTGEIMYETMD